jgi:PAS domain S-box-containing protein
MAGKPIKKTPADPLRARAEAELAHSAPAMPSRRTADALLHELQVHQIELEMQHEQLRQAHLAMEESRDRYVELYDFAPVGYVTLTADDQIAQINLTGATLLGVARPLLLNKRFSAFIVPADQACWSHHFTHVIDQVGRDTVELVMQRGDGTVFHALLDCAHQKVGAGGTAIRIALSDISERKRLEAERNQALATAVQANRAKSTFLSSMSHELRTPLNAILGFAQLIDTGTPPPTPLQQRSIEQILKAGWYLLSLINEILDLALIESDRITLVREPVSLGDVMLECRAMMEAQALQRGIRLAFPRFASSCSVNADPTRVKQVLINLLNNAIKYNRPDGTVVVDCTPRPPDGLRISIRDSGAGLTAEQLAQLFQPFNRLGKETSTEEGTGIGLVVTKRLVELMGGVIGVESTVGVGSTFWVEFSLADAPQLAETESGPAAELRPAVWNGAPLRTVLYVEDNLANLELVEQLVARRSDLRLLTAADGDLGIRMARIHLPEVILMDIHLPGISGIDAMKVLRADAATAHIPIIAISANAMPRDIEKALEAGFFNYVTKPIKVGEFMDTLDAALEFTQAAAIRDVHKEPAS